jgi:hypothetical protein
MLLSELAQRILAELEEAWAENVTSTLNTVLDVKGESEELDAMFRALRELTLLDLIVLRDRVEPMGPVDTLDKARSLARLQDLKSLLWFDTDSQLWTQGSARARAEIVALDAGLEAARKLLDQRGYQWWRNRAP